MPPVAIARTQEPTRRSAADPRAAADEAAQASVFAAGRGRRFRFPKARNYVRDVVWFGGRQPSHPILKWMDLAPIAAARAAHNAAARAAGRPTIGWAALFIQAYGRVAAEVPELRQTVIDHPFAHIYEHPTSVARVAVSRPHDGTDWLFFGPVADPAEKTPAEVQAVLGALKRAPIGETVFGLQVWLSGLPTFLRRFLWWCALTWDGRMRIARAGTFGVTTLGGEGCCNVFPARVQTTVLTYGPIGGGPNPPVAPTDPAWCRVTIVYDHRLMDGVLVAGVLNRLEELLNGPLADGLRAAIPEAAAARDGATDRPRGERPKPR